MKKIALMMTVLMLTVMCVLTVSAYDKTLLVDDYGLLTETEASQVETCLQEYSQKHQADFVIVTVDSIGSKSPEAFADDYFDYNGYGQGANRDGVLLLIAMGSRDVQVSTRGSGIVALTDYGIDIMLDDVAGYLGSGQYFYAFLKYANTCDGYYTQAENGQPFDNYGYTRSSGSKDTKDFSIGSVFAAIGGAFFTAFVPVSNMKKKLTSVSKKKTAHDYVVPGTLNVTNAGEIFLYRNVSRTRIESSSSGGGSSTHRSSSGATHGGGGRKF